jgi:hypothetical protein
VTGDSVSGESIAPERLQFHLRTLLGMIAAAGALFALLSAIGPIWSTVVVWASMLVAAHVLGNACGAKRTGDSPMSRPLLPPADRILLNIRATCLRDRQGPGLMMLVGIALGAIVGGLVGTSVLWAVYWEQFGVGPVSVGGASSAVVGGFLGFLAASFMNVASRAWQEASYELRRRR